MSRKFVAICIGIIIAIPLFIWFTSVNESPTEKFSRIPERLLSPLNYQPLFSLKENAVKKYDVWSQYTDPAARFTFRYPPGWKLLGSGDSLSLASMERFALLSDPSHNVGERPEISITVLQNPTQQSLENFAKTYESGWFTLYREVKPITIANKTALLFSDVGAPSGHAPLQAFFIDATRFILFVTLNDVEGQKTPEQRALLDDILFTLIF